MSQKNERIVADIESVILVLKGLADFLRGDLEEIVLPPDIAARVENRKKAGICLHATDDHASEEGFRGCCKNDYETTMRNIRQKKHSERWYIEHGLLFATPGKRGRKPKHKSLADEIIDESSDTQVAKMQSLAKDADKKSRQGKKDGGKKT